MSNYKAVFKDQLRFPAWLPSDVKAALLSSPLSTGAIALLLEILEQDADCLEFEGGYEALALRVAGDRKYRLVVENLLLELSRVRLLIQDFGGIAGYTLHVGPVASWAWSPAHSGQPEMLWLGSPLSRFYRPKSEVQS